MIFHWKKSLCVRRRICKVSNPVDEQPLRRHEKDQRHSLDTCDACKPLIMSVARNQFLARISSLARSIQIDAVKSRPLTEQAHNDVARILRNGLAVVGFASLEDFIKSRTSEVLSEVGRTHVPFRNLPEKLRFATTFEALSALRYQLSLKSNADRIAYIQDHTQRIASTASAAYELSTHALGYDQANLKDSTIKSILKCFLVDDPWGEMTTLARRIGLISLPLDETYRSAELRRHQAAHVAHADTPQTDLAQFTKEALATAIGFDALLSRALARMYALDDTYLRGTSKVSASSIAIRTIKRHDNIWRETIEGRRSAVKVESNLDVLIPLTRTRAVAAKNLLVIFNADGEVEAWECY